jgi:predicted amidophosphoribosyltransferase
MFAMIAQVPPPQFLGFLVVLVAAVLLFLLITTAAQHRRHSAQTQTRICPGCGQSHPGHAAFCRRCGRKLEKTKE